MIGLVAAASLSIHLRRQGRGRSRAGAARSRSTAKTLAWMLIGYGFLASVLPVWLLLAPRDYLSTFLKIGTVVLLALAIVWWSMPELQMPAVTQVRRRHRPGVRRPLFPFLFITIACGAVSGWHSLVSSGTTPKLLANEPTSRMIGYGGMLIEVFVAVMALVAACALQPGVYFAMNSPAALIGTDARVGGAGDLAVGLRVTPEMLTADRARHRRDHASCRAPAARRRSRSAWRRSSAASCRATACSPSGTTTRSCSRRCSSSPRSTPARASAAS